MADVPQWFVWRLEWSPEEGKYLKTPCAHDGSAPRLDASLPSTWADYDRVVDVVTALNKYSKHHSLKYAVGFWMTRAAGVWFLDMDKCVNAGVVAPFAMQLVEAFPGAMVEFSSSGKGLHVIGSGPVPANHRNKPERGVKDALAPIELEFYTEGRGIAFGLTGEAQGCADTRLDVMPLCAAYFPPRPERDTEGVRPEWRGPADDDVLIERFLNARQSAAAAFGGKAGLPQLWRGECAHDSESDMALASHLAFWTGCDEERIERLMLRSGLRRAKWSERRPHGTYLTFTIANACATCDNVYQEPERNLAVQEAMYALPFVEGAVGEGGTTVTHVAGELVSAELFAKVDALVDAVTACPTELLMHNEVIPSIRAAGIPLALQERLVGAVQKQLKFWGNGMGVGKLRALLFPPAQRVAQVGELPDWAKDFCFVVNGDKFYNLNNTVEYSINGFHAVFGRHMPITDGGRRENAAEKCLHFWNMPVVERIGYRPDRGSFFEWDGVQYANSYSASSFPATATAYSERGIAGIQAFQSLLYDMCSRRQDVFLNLLYWFAHNVQHPGKKIRWAPIIKGVHGDGKTLVFAVLRAAMGHRNVNTTSNSNISNSGGFTDWAVRGAVNVIEEIMLVGKARHQLYNAMKEFISNNICDINPKGGKPYQSFNTTNHAATTNHNDGLPMEKTDRRWFVIFTPWESLDAMRDYCGLDAAGWKTRTDSIDHALNHCASEVRAWFMSIQVPAEFDINGSAMMTPEKTRMMASGSDDAEASALSIIAEGGLGITERLLSSSMLSQRLTWKANQDGFEVPRSTALNHLLTRLGYSKMEKQVKWNGRTHTIWLRNGVEVSNEDVRFELDATQTTTSNLKLGS